MPHKIGFVVVSSSGHEDGFSARELMVHAPTVSGWRSPRFCQFPQEIVLQMVERCRVRKLQLLAHQCLIPSKVEFYVGQSLPERLAPRPAERFRRLGYVSLCDNEKTGCKARELKSVYVDAVGQFLKLVFHQNHVNKYNAYNQVALVAINIIGDPADVSDESDVASREKLIDHYLGHSTEDPALEGTCTVKSDYISPLDDLAFDMYQDPEVAQIIRKLDERKREAVRKERYDYAKQLKQAIADLQKRYCKADACAQVGERLGRFEVEKRCAVEKEDYDLAKEKKQQMERYRSRVYEQLRLHDLMDAELVGQDTEAQRQRLEDDAGGADLGVPCQARCPPFGSSSAGLASILGRSVPGFPALSTGCEGLLTCPYSPSSTLSAPTTSSWYPHCHHQENEGQEATLQTPSCRRSLRPLPRTLLLSALQWTSHRPPQTLLPRPSQSLCPNDERPLPAIRQQPGVAAVELERSDRDGSEAPRAGAAGEPEPLTEKVLREASSAVDVLGEALVAGAYSRSWSHREGALLALYEQLSETPVGTPREDLKNTLRASVFLIRRAIRDIVTPVFQASLKLLKMIITQYIPKHKLSKLETAHCVERTVPLLLARTGDTSARLRSTASNFIQEMALCKEVRSLQIIPAYLVQPLKAGSSAHLAISQMALLARLLRDLGTEGAGFTVDSVMKFSARALEHRVPEVREAAVRLILGLYAQHRAAVLEHLPPADSATRKNVLYKTIFEGFAKIDGRPTDAEIRAQKRVATEEAEKRKEEEMTALQGQAAAPRELQARARARALQVPRVSEKESEAAKAQDPDTPGGKAAPPSAPEIPDSRCLDNLCIFCGERSESFTEEGLDLHYWKHCLMLTRCDHCRQVVEICSLTEHLLTECDKKASFGKCHRCSEAVVKEELPRHIKAKDCNPAKPEKLANRCPLCHENFTPGEEAWKAHLMGPAGCTMNLRRTHVLHKAPVPPPGKGPATSTIGTSVSKVGSKIPTPRGGLRRGLGRTFTKR
ncbi:Centrosomal protein of 104 kDa [Camelus dromedarius]|uniref:Centrosomal protein of 104 kDa n=1 Tax=Camelus dromedarius TaxID=9838 RepID=A0A5N4DAP0_CAMDR|nr:Centrosomal protein of 104 kDa [Camelus dromedarius]